MEGVAAVDSTSLRSAEDSTPTTTTRPEVSEHEAAWRSHKTERMLMSLAWILAISSFLYLMSLTLFYAWFATSSLSSQTESEFAGDLSLLTSSDGKGSFLRALFHGSDQTSGFEPHVKIPKIIHQTYKTDEIPEEMQTYVASWKERNPSWQYVFYNDTDCLEFVRREFPHYLEAYQSLPKNVERSDFFRYLVVLRYGGVYADLDAECMVPLDQIIQPNDVFVVGWECDTPSVEAAIKRHFVRRRQIVQWVFAAAPGHPVLREICEFIAQNSLTQFSNVSSNHNTLEKTGPGAWTDTILRHTHRSESRHQIRILPQVAFGVHPSGTDGLHPGSDGILVQHHFLGSWKRGGWGERHLFSSLFHAQSMATSIIKPAPVAYFPVSASFTPPFVVMVHPAAAGEFVGNSDVSSEITLRGSWQAGTHSLQNPRVVDVIAGSLGNVHMHLHLLDIGAGLGFFSLAAASRRHPVLALEPLGSNLEPMKQSIQANNFTEDIRLYSSISKFKQAMNPSCATPKTQLWDRQQRLQSSNLPPASSECHIEVGALRVGDSGWSAWNALNGSTYVDRFEPEIVAIEFSPWRMREAGMKEPETVLHELVNLGYEEVYHAGQLCERRWHVLSKHVLDLHHEDKPTWCTVSPSDFSIFQHIDKHEEVPPENVLFVKRKAVES